MHIVDTHCHIGLHKYEPVEALLFHMQRAEVEQAVFIQYAGNFDNGYIVDSMAAHPGKFAAAMMVAPSDNGDAIRLWHERGIGGIRINVDARATGSDSLAHWRTANELDLVVSSNCTPRTLLGDTFADVLRQFPNLRIVIEHLGGANKPPNTPDRDTFRKMMALAERDNLWIKLPGFGEFCELPHPFEEVPPLADMALDAFGPARMMWGSDWPPVSSREGYDNSLSFPLHYFRALSETERAQIFGGTAQQVWNLK